MLPPQPPTQPITHVSCDAVIGLGDRAETELVGPAPQQAVQPAHHPLFVQPPPTPPAGLLAQLPTHLLKLFRRRPCPDIGAARPRRVQPPEGVPQKVKRFVRPPTESGFRLVDRQP